MRFRHGLPVTALLALTLALAQPAHASPIKAAKAPAPSLSFTGDVLPLLNKYCTNCHGGMRPRAGFPLDRYKTEEEVARVRQVWQKVVERLRAGDMPPEFRKQPSPAE